MKDLLSNLHKFSGCSKMKTYVCYMELREESENFESKTFAFLSKSIGRSDFQKSLGELRYIVVFG